MQEVIEERKQSEDNLAQFKKHKLEEFQEVIRSKSDEIEALNQLPVSLAPGVYRREDVQRAAGVPAVLSEGGEAALPTEVPTAGAAGRGVH